MKTIVSGPAVAAFVGASVGETIYPPFEAIGIEENGEIIGGAVFNCWTGPDIHASVAGRPDAWSRRYLRAVGQYVFNDLGCERITIITRQRHVAGIAVRLGGRVEGVKRNQFGRGRDGVLIGILKDDWFLNRRAVAKE